MSYSLTYTISEAASLLNINTKTLRRWEQKGYISPPRDIKNNRIYSQIDIQKIRQQLIKPSNHLVTLSQASTLLDVSPKTIRRWIKAKILKPVYHNRKYYFDAQDIKILKRDRSQQPLYLLRAFSLPGKTGFRISLAVITISLLVIGSLTSYVVNSPSPTIIKGTTNSIQLLSNITSVSDSNVISQDTPLPPTNLENQPAFLKQNRTAYEENRLNDTNKNTEYKNINNTNNRYQIALGTINTQVSIPTPLTTSKFSIPPASNIKIEQAISAYKVSDQSSPLKNPTSSPLPTPLPISTSNQPKALQNSPNLLKSAIIDSSGELSIN